LGPEDAKIKALLDVGRQNVEKLLRQVVEDDEARLQLNLRNASFGRVSVRLRGDILIPSLRHLSAGQALLFNLFATIIRYADKNDLNKSIRLDQIEGIVLIDEIDAHLHADLQFEVLPKLLKLFPRVQFVVTTHSPLFLLGMEREFGDDGVQILELPGGRNIGTERFDEFRRSFDVYRQTKIFEDEVECKVQRASMPLVLTEGQTDVALIRTALTLLGHLDILSAIEVDQIGESRHGGAIGGGASSLQNAYKFLRNNHRQFNRKVLLLFDSDTMKQATNTGPITVRAIPKNPENTRVPGGIENLLPDGLFEDRFYSEVTTQLIDGGLKSVKTLNKEMFCRYICEERKKRGDFAAFETYLVPLLREFISDPAELGTSVVTVGANADV
jgi:hypothetical protein